MKPPPKRKTDDPILASEWNQMIDAIAARTPQPGRGLALTTTAGGFAYSGQPQASGPAASLPPFAVAAIARDGENHQVTIREGWVIERKPKDGDTPVVKFHMPTSGGTALDAIPRPQIAMTTGDTLYCKYETDATGEITGTPYLFAAASEPAGTHYQPANPDESGGIGGIYHVKLFKLEDADGTPAVKVWQQSDIEHWAQLWTGENVGDYGEGVFQKHDAATGKFRFRKLHGTGGVEVALKENEEYIEISLAAVEGLTGYVCYQNIHLYGPESPYPPDYYYYFHKFVAGRLVAVYESSSNNPPEGYGELLQEIQMNNGD